MSDSNLLTRYRLILVTALLSAAATVRVVWPDFVLPDDAALSSWVDAALAAAAPVVWLYTFYKTDTTKNSLEG